MLTMNDVIIWSAYVVCKFRTNLPCMQAYSLCLAERMTFVVKDYLSEVVRELNTLLYFSKKLFRPNAMKNTVKVESMSVE